MANFYASYPFLVGSGGGGGGSVTSVGLADGSSTPIFVVSGSPVTSTGTLTFTLASQSANTVFAGPTTGVADQPAFRSLVAADLPFSIGDITDAGTDGIVITGGTGAIIGSGVSLAQHVADASHNGYLSSTDWSTFNSKQSAGNYITALTGDGTASGPGSVALTLATVNANVGSFGGATAVGTFTVNGKGLVTAAGSTSIQIAESQVTNLVSDLAGKQATVSIGSFNGTSTANGLDITAAVLTLHAADGTNPGALSVSAQTLAGIKTFSSAPVMSALTASQVVVTDAGKALASLPYATAPAASTLAEWDASKNLRANIVSGDLATTATAAGTTTLTVASKQNQQFTGTTTQTVVLPDATTLVAGQGFTILNRSTGIVTVNANGGGLIQTMVGGSQATISVVTVATSAGTWDSQYTVTGIVAAVQPTIQKFTSGTAQTYTTPSGVQYLRVRMVGGGGGGGASGSGSPGDGTAGTASTLGTSLLSAGGGSGGGHGAGAGGAGGTSSLGTGPIGTALSGGNGGGASFSLSASYAGGDGAASFFGGSGSGASGGSAGGAASTNTGGGGGGGSTNTTSGSGGAGAGGGSGGFIDAIISSPSATYTYTVGAKGNGGGAGTNGFAGGDGAVGYIEVTEYYTNLSVGSTTVVTAGTYLGGPYSGSAALPTFKAFQTPTKQLLTSGTGATYTTPAGVLYLIVNMVGGGGGGGGSGTTNGTAATNGGDTIWTTTAPVTLLQAAGGGLGARGAAGGTRGTSPLTITSPAIDFGSSVGNDGVAGSASGAVATEGQPGGTGGASGWGRGGASGGAGSATGGGGSGTANTGAGGGGASVTNVTSGQSGSGGGGGAYIRGMIPNPAASYLYTIGAAGSGQAAGTSGAAGGAGGTGYIVVEEYYQ